MRVLNGPGFARRKTKDKGRWGPMSLKASAICSVSESGLGQEKEYEEEIDLLISATKSGSGRRNSTNESKEQPRGATRLPCARALTVKSVRCPFLRTDHGAADLPKDERSRSSEVNCMVTGRPHPRLNRPIRTITLKRRLGRALQTRMNNATHYRMYTEKDKP